MTDGATTAEAGRVLAGASDDAMVEEIERRLFERMHEGRLDVADCNMLASRIHSAIASFVSCEAERDDGDA